MKKITLLLSVIALTLTPLIAFAQLPVEDELKGQLFLGIKSIEEAVNNKNTDFIISTLSPNVRPELSTEITSALDAIGSVRFNQYNSTYEQLSENQYKVVSKYNVQVKNLGSSWNVSGFKNFFIFEAIDGQLFVLDTDLGQILTPTKLFKFTALFLPIFLALFTFWVWMLVDATKRPLQRKTAWILAIVFLNWFGAILYFFIGRRKAKKQQKALHPSQSVPIQ